MIKKYIKKKINRYLRKYFIQIYSEVKHENELREWDNLKVQLKSCGENLVIPAPYIIKNPQYISIGDNFSALHNLRLEAWDSYGEENFKPILKIGNNVIFQSDCHVGCIDSVIIEDNVLLASRVYISDHIHGSLKFDDLEIAPRLRKLSTKGTVIIKQNAWIGEGVSIMPNITIGKYAIIGANSVVTKNIPDYAIAVGNPAKVIKIGK